MIDNYVGKWDKKRMMYPNEFVRDRVIDGIKITLPEPPDMEEIMNYDLPINKQKWIPPVIPSDKELKELPSEERIAFIRRELDRRNNGLFFYNHGGIEYITGIHYFYLTYWKLEGVGLPEFRDSNRDTHYCWDAAVNDENCYGLAFFTNRRDGKALCLDTKIPTPDGWKTMRDLEVGDKVFDSKGNVANITFVTGEQLNRECFEVKFSDGSTIIADKEHLWIAKDKPSRACIRHSLWESHDRIVSTGDMMRKMKIGKPGKEENNWSIVNCLPVHYPKKDLKIPPYIMGLWLGDGSSAKPALTNIDNPIIDTWYNYAESLGLDIRVDKGITYHITSRNRAPGSNMLLNHLKHYNLINNKHIPKDYLQSSVHDRMELLKGLMDTDGSSKSNSRSLEYCSKSMLLISGIKELIESLGYKVTLTSKYNKKHDKEYYYLRYGVYDGNYPFKLQRKLDNITESNNPAWRTNHRYVTSITPVETRPVKCISVDSSDNSYLCGENFIVTHNTAQATNILYESASREKEVHCGIQSQTNKDAKNVFRKVVFSWKKMPYFWKPVDSGDKNPKESLRFEEPSSRSTKGEEKTYKNVLDSMIDFGSSTETAYDGYKLFRYYCDEFGKFTEGNAYDRWNIVKPCLRVGMRIIGKAIFTTTVEELEKGGGQAAYDIYLDSDPTEIQADGRTKSGLWRLFKPAYYGLEGFIDEYGYSDIDGAKKALLAERQTLQGKDLAALTRKYPFNPKEAFQSSIGSNVFPVFKIQQQKEYNLINDVKTRVGNFRWEDRDNYKVKFVDDPNGKFEVSWMPQTGEENKFEMINGLPSPLNKNKLFSGVDSFDHRTTVDSNRYSKGAMAGFRKYDPMNPSNSNSFFLKYLARPPKETIFYEDVIMACVFYGMQFLPENNKPGIINWALDNGFKHYIMRTQQGDYTKSSSRKWVYGVATSGEIVREIGIGNVEEYIYDYIGKISPDIQRNKFGIAESDINPELYGVCPFSDILDDWEKFDSSKWTIYDMTVATIITMLAVTPVRNKRVEVEEKPKFTFESFFTKYKL